MPAPLQPKPMIELTLIHCESDGRLQGTCIHIQHAEWVTDPVNVLAKISDLVSTKLDQAVAAVEAARVAGPKGLIP